MHSSICLYALCNTLSYSLVEPILEKFKFDFNSDEPLDVQELEGNKRLRKYCLESVEAAKEEREIRVEEAREAYQAQMKEEEELRIQVSNFSNNRITHPHPFCGHCLISLPSILTRPSHIGGNRKREEAC